MNTRHVSRYLRSAALALTLALVCGAAAARPIALAPGDKAPDLTGVTYPVQRAFTADWSAAKLTLVNFWATWCLPCKEEMPVLNELYAQHREAGFQVIGPFERWEAERIDAYVKSVGGVDYTLIKPHATTDYYWGGLSVKPISFLINADGRVLRKYVGANEVQLEGLKRDVAAALAGEPLPTQVMPTESVMPEEFKERIERNRAMRGLSKEN